MSVVIAFTGAALLLGLVMVTLAVLRLADAIERRANVAPPEGSQPIETIRYWAGVYTNPGADQRFQGHGMAAQMLREYLALREAVSRSGGGE